MSHCVYCGRKARFIAVGKPCCKVHVEMCVVPAAAEIAKAEAGIKREPLHSGQAVIYSMAFERKKKRLRREVKSEVEERIARKSSKIDRKPTPIGAEEGT